MRTAALSPHSGIPAPILRTTRSLRIYQCRHASDPAATATWEPSRPGVPKMTTQLQWTRAALHLWLTPLFAPTAPAQVNVAFCIYETVWIGYGGSKRLDGNGKFGTLVSLHKYHMTMVNIFLLILEHFKGCNTSECPHRSAVSFKQYTPDWRLQARPALQFIWIFFGRQYIQRPE